VISSHHTRHTRRRVLAAGVAGLAAAGPAVAARRNPVRVALLGQGLIQYDLRSQSWSDRDKVARLVGRADVGFTNLETAGSGNSPSPASGCPSGRRLDPRMREQ
jgi:hypothetical protein